MKENKARAGVKYLRLCLGLSLQIPKSLLEPLHSRGLFIPAVEWKRKRRGSSIGTGM